MGFGLLTATILGIYGAKWGFQLGHSKELFRYGGFSWTEAGTYALAGYLAAGIPLFFIGRLLGFLLGYPIEVLAQLILLAEKIELNTRATGRQYAPLRLQETEPVERPRPMGLPKLPAGVEPEDSEAA